MKKQSEKRRNFFNHLFQCLIVMILGLYLCACGDSQRDSSLAADNREDTGVFGDWFVEEYVDEFGDSTGSSFCYTICDGTFENSATSGSDLIAGVYFDSYHEAFSIRLLEYSETKASYLSDADITVKCKVEDYTFEDILIGTPPNGDLVLSSSSAGYKNLYRYLGEGKEIRTVIYIDNSKYNFTISGKGFKEVLAEQEAREKQKGISGTYKNAILVSEDWFVIKQETSTSGTITAADKYGSATLDYTYDPSTYILKVVLDDEWSRRCSYDTFFIYDSVLVPEYGSVKGSIPDGKTFDASVTWVSPDSQEKTTYTFRKDGTFVETGTYYDGEKKETETGTYTRVDSFIMQKYSYGYVWTDYVYNGKFYPAPKGVYVIDK